MFNFIDRKGNANQNYKKPPHASQKGYYQTKEKCTCQDAERGQPCALLVAMLPGTVTVETHGSSTKH